MIAKSHSCKLSAVYTKFKIIVLEHLLVNHLFIVDFSHFSMSTDPRSIIVIARDFSMRCSFLYPSVLYRSVTSQESLRLTMRVNDCKILRR